MKRIIAFITVLFVLASFSASAYADDYSELLKDYGADSLSDSLPDEAKNSLSDIGVDGPDISDLNELSFQKIIDEILSSAAENGSAPLRTLALITAVMLLYSVLYGVKGSFDNSSMQQVMSVCVTLSVTAALVNPAVGVIKASIDAFSAASGFMLAYLPVMLAVMTASGRAVSGGSYYALMSLAGQAVAQVSSRVLAPFLKLFLGLSIACAISPSVNLGGFVRFLSKLIKWGLGFIMTLFTGALTLRQLISGGLDSVGTRAVKFTLSSLVPVVGSALSEAYKTVQSSVGLLRSGVGVFALLAVIAVFMPVVIKCLWWLLVLWLSKSAGELMGLKEPCFLLESVSSVFSVILAITLSVCAVFVISTAALLIMGGS